MDGRLIHLADQILAAYQDESKDSLAPFRQLINEASSQMTLDEWKETCKTVGYDVDTNTWDNNQ